MKPLHLLALLAAVAGMNPLLAQQSPSGQNSGNNRNDNDRNREEQRAPGRPVFWKAELPAGSFLVAREAIESVSLQQYILDGAARVTEVNIGTSGNFQPRFYYLEALPATAMEAVPPADAVATRARDEGQVAATRVVPGDPIWAKVVKNYPVTTHAGTIEFRLETAEQLDKLFESVERVWTGGKSEVFTPEGTESYKVRAKKQAEDDDSPFGQPEANGEN